MQIFDEEVEAKVKLVHQLRCLSKLAADLHKQIQEMKTNPQPGMPLDVLHQRQQLTTQFVSQLRKSESIYEKVVEAIATAWEQLIDDAVAE